MDKKQKNDSFDEIRQKLNALAKTPVKNREALEKVLIVLALYEREVAAVNSTIRTMNEIANSLSEQCTRYALKQETLFRDGLIERDVGTRMGDVVLATGEVFHFTASANGYERLSGQNKTQAFLATLPENWRRTKLELNVTGITRDNPTTKTLAKHDLCRGTKYAWAMASTDEAAKASDEGTKQDFTGNHGGTRE